MLNVYHYFQRACQRDLRRLLGLPGNKITDDDGNSVIVWLRCEHGIVVSAQYKCTTCFTLVALCEHMADLLPGMSLETAGTFPAEQLLSLHPEIPGIRSDRARLVIGAVRSALEKQLESKGACV